MSEILSNTGVKLWAETDYSELWLTVFDQLTGQGGKSNIRLIDEAIGKINAALDGYKFEFSSDEDRLYISKGDSKLPVSLIDSNGHVASKVDGTTIIIDENGIVKGIPVDDALSEESTNPLQNKVIAGELKNIKSQMSTDESTIESNTKRIEANETAISTLNGTGDGSVKKAVSDGIAEVVAGAPEDFDTLKEMSDWISSHESSASSMNTQIQDNKKAIDNHASNGDIHVTTENKTNWNKVFEKLDKTGDASNVTTEFTTATTRSNLTTKEKLSISLGKISKWFSDLKTVAFSGNYNDLNNKPTSLPASDVSSWAKATTKPTYTKAEVGLGNVDNTADANKSVKHATSADNATKVNNHTVNADVPANAKFTDTTYGAATTSELGLIKPDGTTITVDADGIAHGVSKIDVDDALSDESTNPVQNKVVNEALEGKANNIIFDATNNKLSLASGETTLKEVAGIQKGYYVGRFAPENKNVLWIDALDCGIAKYYVDSSKKWRPVRARGLTSSIDLIKEDYWTDIKPGSGITYGTISAIYDINANKITVDIDKIEVASDAVIGPSSLITIKVLEYNTGHKTINAVSSKNAPTTVSMRFDYPWAYIQFGNGAPYGIYKGTTATSIKFEISNPSDRT